MKKICGSAGMLMLGLVAGGFVAFRA